MKTYSMMETRAGKAAFGIFLFAMLVLARDTLVTSMVLGFNKSQFLMLGLICLFGLAFLTVNRHHLKDILLDKRMILLGLSAVILLLPMLMKRDWQMMYFSILICLFFAVFLTFFTRYQEVARYYVVSLTLLCLHSLVTMYLLKGMALQGKIAPPVLQNSAGQEFFNFGLSFVVPNAAWQRNFGIFREPGVYQFFLILGLYLNNYAADWKRLWQLWLVNLVLGVTMLSTFAIGGFVEMGLFAVFLYFDKKWYRGKWGKILGIGSAAAVIAAAAFVVSQINPHVYSATVYYEIYDMFLRLTTKSDSLVDRLAAIWVNVQHFLDKPLFGDAIASVLHGTEHNTSSTLILYAIFGIAGGTLNAVAWVALLWKRERNVFGNLVLLLILFMSFNTQNLVADVFFWLFPYMALTQWVLPKLKLPERKA